MSTVFSNPLGSPVLCKSFRHVKRKIKQTLQTQNVSLRFSYGHFYPNFVTTFIEYYKGSSKSFISYFYICFFFLYIYNLFIYDIFIFAIIIFCAETFSIE